MFRVAGYLLRRLYLLFAIALIILAVLVQLARSFSYMASDYADELGAYLSERIGLQVSFGQINADWQGLKPIVQLYDVRLRGDGDEQILAIDHARLQLDLWGSVIRARLHWDTIALQGSHMEFQQLPDGRWQIPGLPRAQATGTPAGVTTGAPAPDDFFALFLLGTQVRFQDTHFVFHFADNHLIDLYSPRVLLENHRGFHRLMLDMDVADRTDSVRLVVEGRGNPRLPRQFHTSGYLQLRDIPTMEPLSAVAALLLDGIDQRTWHSSGSLNAGIWFDSRPDGAGIDLVGQLELGSVSLPLAGQTRMLHHLKTDLTGYWLRAGGWNLALQGLTAHWDDSRLERTNVAVVAEGSADTLQVKADQLDLHDWARLLDGNQVFGDGVLQEVIHTLAPRGELRNIELTLPLNEPGDWQLAANLQSVAVDPWRGVPGLTGVDGLLRANRQGGSVDVDSRDRFSMFYPGIYERPMVYQHVRGQVAWWLQPEANRIYVNSGLLELANEGLNADERAHGYLWLSLPWQRNSADVDLYLYIDAHHMSANLHRKYVPRHVPEALADWLNRAIGINNAGRATDGSFIFRGTLSDPDPMARSYQLALDIADARLDYHPGWPLVHDLAGRLLLDDNLLTATIEQGRVYNSELEQVTVSLAPNPRGEHALLSIEGDIRGIASDGLRVLRESLLRDYVGDNMDSWYMHGDMRARLALDIPLGAGEPGARHELAIDVNASSMALDNFGVELGNVAGKIHYSNRKGLSAGLQARLFEEPITIDISSHGSETAPPQTHIELASRISIDNLTRWVQRPELGFFEGATDVSAHIQLTHNAAREEGRRDGDDLVAAVTVATELEGVIVKLPNQYGKAAAEKRSLSLNLILGRQTALAEVRYSDLVHAIAQLQREDNRLLNANLALGARAQLRDPPQLVLSGYLDDLNMEPWQQLLQDYQQLSGHAANDGDLLDQADLPPLRAELLVRNHTIGGLALTDLALTAARADDVWQLAFTNDVVSGTLLAPEGEKPLQLSLSYLHLPRAGESEAPEERAASEVVDPRTLPRADVTIDALHLGDEHYGSVVFNLRPDQGGALFEGIHADIRGLQIRGREPDTGAQLYWQMDEQRGHHTRFSGLAQAGDLAEVMRAWQQPTIIESQQARYLAELDWPGAPQDFTLAGLNGDLTIDIRDGRFTRTPAGGSDGLLRLFAILNFDSLARRLRLDFTDLYQSGLAYDEIRGRVGFDQGIMRFTEPLQVRSPSSRMQLSGSVNLLEETLDTRLIATLPVAGNLTFLTALAAGLPAAAGVYLVSKLFERQVDQATSISYAIRGDWDDPQIKFDRMFEADFAPRAQGQ